MDALSPPATPSAAALRDRDIQALLVQGDRAAAFELIAQRYENKVYRLCVAMLRDPAAAQDAAQESLVRVWRALPAFDARAALSTWIYAITRNRCLTALERARADLSLTDESVQAEAEAVCAHDAQPAAEQAQTIHQLVDELPEGPRRVITLYYFEERAVAEVAAMLGCPEGTVKTHLFRARAALLGRMKALGLADPALWAA
jgi:RNA polymerase sigma-70 factor (ECF subfamily)